MSTGLDQVISPSFQDRMLQATPARSAVTLQAGHLRFLTDPDGRTKAIIRAAEQAAAERWQALSVPALAPS